MLKIERFVNQLMASNCYVVVDEERGHCLCIDPASEKSEKEIAFIEQNGLTLDYIILTHEHTDHNWGVNALKQYFPCSLLVCSELCNRYVKNTNHAYFLLYFDDPDYRYEIPPADVIINSDYRIKWYENQIVFVITPGHSYGSMCIDINGNLFTGDTIMPYKPYFNGRDSNQDDWAASIERMAALYQPINNIYPGHGDVLRFDEWLKNHYI